MNLNQDGIEVGRRGRDATMPTDIPKRGWLDIAWRVKREAEDDAVTFYADTIGGSREKDSDQNQ